MTDQSTTYQGFAQQQGALQDILSRATSMFTALEMAGWERELEKMQGRLNAEGFKVMVLGEFKRGKSTFINALLGQEVLPAYAVPCTAVINEVKWGETPRALAHFKSPIPEPLPERLPDAVKTHITRAGGGEVAPLTIPIDELETYVVIDDPGKDQAESVAETPYSRVELFWPLELCRQKVEIIDSPGLNEHGTRTQVTTNYLREVDAVIFVISCTSPVSQSELQVIDNDIRGNGHEELFFIFNRADQVNEKDKDRLRKYAHDKLLERTGLGEQGIFFISSLDALEGRTEGNRDRFAKSGMSALESRLATFLVQDRGRVKLLQPARELRLALQLARRTTIPQTRQLLNQDLATLEQRYSEVQPQLEAAEQKRGAIIKQCENGRARVADTVRRSAEMINRELAGKLQDWVKEFEPENKVKIFKVASAKKQSEALMLETIDYLNGRINDELAKWKRDQFVPLVTGEMEGLSGRLGVSVDEFMTDIGDIRSHLTGVQDDLDNDGPSGLERALAAGGALVLFGDVGGALTGGMFGVKEMAKTVAVNIGVFLVGFVVLGMNPITIIPFMLATGVIQSLLRQDVISSKITSKVAEHMASQLRERATESADEIVQGVNAQTLKMQEAIGAGLQIEIDAIRQQVEAVLEEKRQGEAEVARRRTELDDLEARANQIDDDLTVFMLAVSDISTGKIK